MNRAYKYRIYPNKEQSVLFAKTFGCRRKIYNLMLADKLDSLKRTGKICMTTPAGYKKLHPYLKEVDSLALANAQMDLQKAFRDHFKNPKKFRMPRFKSAKRSRRSYTTNNQSGSIRFEENGIRLPKAGVVKAVIHRKPGPSWILKSATVSQEKDNTYYISVLFEYSKSPVPVKPAVNVIGLDYKSDGLYRDSNGDCAMMPKYFRSCQKKLACAQRKLSRKRGSGKGEAKSSGYLKQLHKVNKIYRHAANQRLDYLHKRSAAIAKQYDVVCVENLDMKTLANRKFGNGKATMDNGYGMFLKMLEYKLQDAGGQLIKIDKWYPSSQMCSCCGRRHKLKLSERTYSCDCGNIMDRDTNAARNIRKEGMRLLVEGIVA